MQKQTKSPPREVSLKMLCIVLACTLLSTLLVHRYVFAVYVIQGSSMSPTLQDGDTALVNMLVWQVGDLERGEIVLVRDGLGGFATKRIVGLPGEKIKFSHGRVYINHRLLEEPYLLKDASTDSERGQFDLATNEYFVLGDNRPDSYDSRIYGPVTKDAIVGSYTRTFWACR